MCVFVVINILHEVSMSFYLLEVPHLILQSIIYFEAHCASALTVLLPLKADRPPDAMRANSGAPVVPVSSATDFLLSSCAGAPKDIMCRFSMLVNSHGLKFIISMSFGCFLSQTFFGYFIHGCFATISSTI